MKNSLLALGALVAAGAAFAITKKAGGGAKPLGSTLVAQAKGAPQDPTYAAGPSYQGMLTSEAWRTTGSGLPPGAADWYQRNATQTAITQDAINANWRDVEASAFKSQPEFWV